MLAKVACLWEEGRQVPRWQLSQVKEFKGELRIEEGRDEYLNRFMRTAKLIDADKNPIDVVPPLHDVAVLWMRGKTMTMTGFERDVLGKAFAQTWLIEFI